MNQILLSLGEDGYWIAECPTLLGCISQGRTRDEAIENIREAMALYVEALEDDYLSWRDATFDGRTVAELVAEIRVFEDRRDERGQEI